MSRRNHTISKIEYDCAAFKSVSFAVNQKMSAKGVKDVRGPKPAIRRYTTPGGQQSKPLVAKISSDREVMSELEKDLPNLPALYLRDHKNTRKKSCGKLPALTDIHYNNHYWQEMTTSNGTFYLYGAYLDLRELNRLGPTVRILGMIDRLEPIVETSCLLWFSDTQEPVVSKVTFLTLCLFWI